MTLGPIQNTDYRIQANPIGRLMQGFDRGRAQVRQEDADARNIILQGRQDSAYTQQMQDDEAQRYRDNINFEQKQEKHQLAMDEVGRQQGLMREFQTDWDYLVKNPTAENYTNILAKHPTYLQNIREGWDALNEAEQVVRLEDLTSTYVALQNGDYEFVQQKIDDQIEALKAEKGDDNADKIKAFKGAKLALKQNPEQFMAAVGVNLADVGKGNAYVTGVLSGDGGQEGSYTTAQQGRDKDGNEIFWQADKNGNTRVVDGITPNNSLTKVDTGTDTALLNRAGNTVTTIKTNNEQSAYDTQTGSLTAAIDSGRSEKLPAFEQKVNETIDIIDGIIGNNEKGIPEHPGLRRSVGFIDGHLPAFTQNQSDFRVRMAQLSGQAFLQAYQSLKGGGTITEIEGNKAEAAQARLNQAQSEEEFIIAVQEMRGLLITRLKDAQELAGEEPARNNSSENWFDAYPD